MSRIDENALHAAHEIALEIDIVSEVAETKRIIEAYLESAKTQAAPVIKNNSTSAEVVFNDGVFIVQDKPATVSGDGDECYSGCTKYVCRAEGGTLTEIVASVIEKEATIWSGPSRVADIAVKALEPHLRYPVNQPHHSDWQEAMELISHLASSARAKTPDQISKAEGFFTRYYPNPVREYLDEIINICQRNLGKE